MRFVESYLGFSAEAHATWEAQWEYLQGRTANRKMYSL